MTKLAAGLVILILFWGCSPAPRYTVIKDRGAETEAPSSGEISEIMKDKPPAGTKFRGVASYYADKYHGRKTANGEVFDMYGLTCAHNQFPFNTWLEIRNIANDRTVIVRVNDRGPFVTGRIIDLSYGAAKQLEMIRAGVQEVEITVLR